MLLSIGMMVKNEEKHLDECLSSLQPILKNIDSELIIIDTGSTDETINIAKKYTNKLYFHKWNNNFSEMRNIVINYCTGKWFFCIDGDEVLENCSEIIEFFKSKIYRKYKSATIEIKNLLDLSDETNFALVPSVRLFEKDSDFKYIGTVHNKPIFKSPIGSLNVICKHYGYISNDERLMEIKFQRTANLLKNELSKDPNNIYYWYQLSVSYGMHKDYYEAIESIEKAYSLLKNKKNKIDYIYVYQVLCISYINVHDYLNVEKYACECLEITENLIDIHYFYGTALKFLKKIEHSIYEFEYYLKLYCNYDKLSKNLNVVSYSLAKIDDVYWNLSELLSDKKEYDRSIDYLLKINNPRYSERLIHTTFINLCIKSDNFVTLKNYENQMLQECKYEILDNFYNTLEHIKNDLDKSTCNKIEETFSNGSEIYNILNKIRFKFRSSNTINLNSYPNLLSNIDFSKKDFFYGDLIYYALIEKYNISKLLLDCSFEKIATLFEYIAKKYDNVSELIYNYLFENKLKENFKHIRIYKELSRYLIVLNQIESSKLNSVYDLYIEYGIKYIYYTYSSYVIDNICFNDVKNDEEYFLLILNKALKYRDKSISLYIKNLKNALNVFPSMKDLIEYLLNKLDSDLDSNNIEKNKLDLKNKIQSFIENNNIGEAKLLISNYEESYSRDLDVFSMKAIICMIQDKFTDAETLLRQGLEINPLNFDLNYNMAFLQDTIGNKPEALQYYTIANENCKNYTLKETIANKILELSNK